MLRRVYPWLLPLAVCLLLVLSFSIAERVRRNTPAANFNRVQLGMDRDEVLRIIGKPTPIKVWSSGPYLMPHDEWVFQGFWVTVWYDHSDTVTSKEMTRSEFRAHRIGE